MKLTRKQEKEWNSWLESETEEIRALAIRISPLKLYRIKETDHIGFPFIYSEGSLGEKLTITLRLRHKENPDILFERDVFGLLEEELEEVGDREE